MINVHRTSLYLLTNGCSVRWGVGTGGECDAVRMERIVASSGRLPKRRELAGRRRADADPRREGSASDEDGEIASGGGDDGSGGGGGGGGGSGISARTATTERTHAVQRKPRWRARGSRHFCPPTRERNHVVQCVTHESRSCSREGVC